MPSLQPVVRCGSFAEAAWSQPLVHATTGAATTFLYKLAVKIAKSKVRREVDAWIPGFAGAFKVAEKVTDMQREARRQDLGEIEGGLLHPEILRFNKVS